MKSLFSLFAFVVSSVVLFVVSSSLVVAQQVQPPEVEWERWFGGVGDERAYSVQQSNDGGYIVAGVTTSFGAGSRDVYLIKTDAQGSIAPGWPKTFGGVDGDDAYSVQQTSDGGYVVAGRSFRSSTGMIYLIKLNSIGNLDPIWPTNPKTYDGPSKEGNYNYASAFCVKQTSDSGYIVAGEGMCGGAGSNKIYYLKLDSQGNLDTMWPANPMTYGPLCGGIANSIQQTSEGGYIIAATLGGFSIIKLDLYGNLDSTWQINPRVFGVPDNSNNAHSFSQTTDGGYIIAGHTTSFGAGSFTIDVYLVKTDNLGNLVWEKTYGGTKLDYGYSVQQTMDRGYIVAGSTDSFGAGGKDIYLVKIDMGGNKILEKTLGGISDEEARSIHQTTDGGYIVAGSTTSFGAGGSDIYLVKLKPETPIIPPTPLHFYNTAKTPAAWEQLQPPYTVEKFNSAYPTAVLVHGWNSNNLVTLNDLDNGMRSWMLLMADEIYSRLDKKVNILAWDWLEDAKGSKFNLGKPASKITYQSILLSTKLKELFESTSYPKTNDLHIMGHSLGAFMSILTGTNLARNDWHKPAQISLFDIADLARLGGVNTVPWEFDEFIYKLRSQHKVYVDLYHGITSEGDHGCNVWINVPKESINPIKWHLVYEWYQLTVDGLVKPKIFTSNGWFEKNPLVGTLGFEMSPLGLKSRPLNLCGLDKLETLLFMMPAWRENGVSWDTDDFVEVGQSCADFTPPTNNGPVSVTLGTFAGDGSGQKLTDTSIRMTTGSPIAFTLPVTINTNWDYMKFSYNFISAPQKSELNVTLHRLSNDEKRPLFYMGSDAALNSGWSDAGPFTIADVRGERVEFIFEFTSSAPDAVIEIKDLSFLTDVGHSAPKPKANAGPDRAIKIDNSGVNILTLDASASEGTNLRYWWTQNNLFLIDGITPEIYLALGAYELGLTVKDDFDRASEDSVIVEIENEFERGDANQDGDINITDPIVVLGWLFLGTVEEICQDAADADDDNKVDIADAVYILSFLFLGGEAPDEPFGHLGLDPTPDLLGCTIKAK